MPDALLRLIPHPTTLDDRIRVIEAGARWSETGRLRLAFRLVADLSRLRIPAPRPPAAVDELWRHTCFEAFMAADACTAYREINLSPSGEWASYRFRGYRERIPDDRPPAAPRIEVRGTGTALEVEADLEAADLAHRALAVGLGAVIEGDDGALSYWALRHPRSRPDFHDEAARVLRLEPLAREW